MRSRRHLPEYLPSAVMLLCIAVALSSCGPMAEQPASESAPTTEADIAAINSVIDEVGAALNAGDAARWGDLFTEDVIVMRPNELSAIGREANRERLEELFDQYTLDITFSTEEVVVAGDWAFVRDTYSETVTPKGAGEPQMIYGKQINILRRQPDGSWKITRRIHNRNPPPDEGQR